MKKWHRRMAARIPGAAGRLIPTIWRLTMIWFKSCPKCNGDLCDAKDNDVPSVFCLQCGSRRFVTAGTLELATISVEGHILCEFELETEQLHKQVQAE